ncbi:helix-turn-helix domain-containing protein [Ectobacillus panaciterrae]|uniref:helix-turn-helix domain-containing protein n=1 Tax=Ectobacillus panaciterrae TaxID=363872 RepID=UPI0004113793
MKQFKNPAALATEDEQVNELNLMDPNILSSHEAVTEWGINGSTLRKRVKDFPLGTIRKFGTSYAVTREGMIRVFGLPKNYKKGKMDDERD